MALKGFKKASGAGEVIRQERKADGGARLPSARPEMRIHDIPLDRLVRNTLQPRVHFDSESLDDLARAMRERGQLQPILVRPMEDGEHFMVIAGERRWRAAERNGWERIRAVWSTTADAGLDALLENVQRRDLLPLEIALHVVRLRDEQGVTMREIAAAAGFREDEASRLARIAALPDDIREDYFREGAAVGKLVAMGALYEVAMCEDPIRQAMIWHEAKNGAAVSRLRDLRLRADEPMAVAAPQAEQSSKSSDPSPQKVVQRMTRSIRSARKHLLEFAALGDVAELAETDRQQLLELRQAIDEALSQTP